uniref:NADH-ubiquinone oxidoreductase chain 2 n=1 Tax=Leptocorisa lepida TaxID=702478 RepID=A0A8T9ET51_9HEMI|nr:NADH dehydrogenase subunit 2 [Leptocorisa lepida]UNA68811.1 NADH dehydrogenase subunit 2 [Leptocorisa lepida]
MVLNMNKLIFLLMMVLSTLIVMNANNWLGMWMGMEMNLMSFIPLISKSKNKNTSQAMMTYFLTQSLGSMILLFSVVMNPLIMIKFNFENMWIKDMTMLSLTIKLGAAPFHWWLPNMMSNMNWTECFILMTWQKLAPLTMLSNLNPSSKILNLTIILSGLAGSIGGMNQTSIRKLLAYSSINHLGWMMMFVSMSNSWYKYLIIYSMLMGLICYMLNFKNMYFLNQLMTNSPSMMEKFTMTMTLLSIGGLPPFIGFLPKWMVIQSMINSELFLMLMIMLMLSLITLFYYMRMMINYILMFSTMNKWMMFKYININFLYLNISVNIMLPVFLVLNFF